MLKTSRRRFLVGVSAATVLAATGGVKIALGQDRRELRLGVNGFPNSLEPVNGIGNAGNPKIRLQGNDAS